MGELNASVVGAYFTLDPIVGVVTAIVFLGEVLRPGQVGGGIIALVGMWLAATNLPAKLSSRSARL